MSIAGEIGRSACELLVRAAEKLHDLATAEERRLADSLTSERQAHAKTKARVEELVSISGRSTHALSVWRAHAERLETERALTGTEAQQAAWAQGFELGIHSCGLNEDDEMPQNPYGPKPTQSSPGLAGSELGDSPKVAQADPPSASPVGNPGRTGEVPCQGSFEIRDGLWARCSLAAAHHGDHHDEHLGTWWRLGFETTLAHAGIRAMPFSQKQDVTTALTHLARLRRYVTGKELHYTNEPTELTDAVDVVERALANHEHLEAIYRITKRALASGQWEKLEDAKRYILMIDKASR